jgi:Flp pilus assembly protein CpaB
MVDVQVVRGKLPDVQVRTALENLRVLSVIPQPELTSQQVNLPVVTLLATPLDADVLAAADAGGRIRLTLRNSLDAQTRLRSPLTLDGVMKPSGAVMSATSPQPANPQPANSQPTAGGSAKHP